jgi:AraC-like DNA-binding protein
MTSERATGARGHAPRIPSLPCIKHNEVMAAAASEIVQEHVTHEPSTALRPYLGLCTGYREAGVRPALHRGLPSPWLTVIFTLDEPLAMAAHPDPGQMPGLFDVLVGGLHTGPALITHDGAQSGIQLALSPLAAPALLDLPAGELASIDVHGADIFGGQATLVQERLRGERTWAGRFAVLEEFMLTRLLAADERTGISPEVQYAWRQLLRTGGRAGVSELAAETGWSERHLRARFRAQTGLAPKEAGRVIRFDRARRRLARRAAAGQPLALADLAASAGYFDQAHLDRDFRLLAGCAPTSWLAEG